ncbi:E3 ubiquitin-protein ligase RZFP34 isoform X2 [Brassica rapa]|uniref:E3 ubiquitin-protein ligase RZFP34 isoform X2 n=1 Tax=Brassica campestris TaxID=3711 RepID=UPI00142E813C|nr:E3 ubiquitin-protein ligase RZFP34 isoform X2 [Brassica rapa]
MIKIKNLTLTLRILWRLVLGITGKQHSSNLLFKLLLCWSLKLSFFFPSFPSFVFRCSHYRRRCKIRAPCCDEVFDCRHCHNEAKDSLQTEQLLRHDLPRHDVSKLICSLCETEQDVQQNCSTCGVCMGKYFCSKCKFFDDDLSKKQYHCDDCGICRTGGKENFFHCKRCRCCYSKVLEDKHRCLEGALHHNCPVCFEYLFDSTRDITVLRCGHAMHLECTKDMGLHNRYTCPLCSKSICDMSSVWKKLDEEVAAYKIPKVYEDKMVWILCNDCGSNTNVRFHLIAHKCSSCGSYNTRKTQRGPNTHSCSSGGPQVVGLTG